MKKGQPQRLPFSYGLLRGSAYASEAISMTKR